MPVNCRAKLCDAHSAGRRRLRAAHAGDKTVMDWLFFASIMYAHKTLAQKVRLDIYRKKKGKPGGPHNCSFALPCDVILWGFALLRDANDSQKRRRPVLSKTHIFGIQSERKRMI